MKRVSYSMLVAVLLLAFAAQSGAAKEEADKWEVFSKNLCCCLKSDNEGVRNSALQHIVTYGANLQVNDAVFDVVRVFRSHKDERVRQLALAALHKMQNGWSMDFLKRSIDYEKSPTIKKQLRLIVNEYYANKREKKRPSLAVR